jgi:hypothetical protein
MVEGGEEDCICKRVRGIELGRDYGWDGEGLDVYDIGTVKNICRHWRGVIFCFGLIKASGVEEH